MPRCEQVPVCGEIHSVCLAVQGLTPVQDPPGRDLDQPDVSSIGREGQDRPGGVKRRIGMSYHRTWELQDLLPAGEVPDLASSVRRGRGQPSPVLADCQTADDISVPSLEFGQSGAADTVEPSDSDPAGPGPDGNEIPFRG